MNLKNNVKDKFAEIKKSTIQNFHIIDFKSEDTVNIEPFASGVLVFVNEMYYLFSAGHVFNNVDVNTLGFLDPETGDIMQLDGNIAFIDPSIEGQNMGDIAVVKLSSETVDDLLSIGYEFYSVDISCLNHMLNGDSLYLIFGYPVSKSKPVYNTNILKREPLGLILEPCLDVKIYNRCGFKPNVNLLFHFHRNDLINEEGQRASAPIPNGISGCGVWHVDSEGVLKLVGIMFEWEHKESIMMGAILDLPMEVVRLKFDRTSYKSPRSTSFILNM